MKSKKLIRTLTMCALLVFMVAMMAMPAFAASTTGNVSGAIENTWNAAKGQVQSIVNNVVFPVIDMILASPTISGKPQRM